MSFQGTKKVSNQVIQAVTFLIHFDPRVGGHEEPFLSSVRKKTPSPKKVTIAELPGRCFFLPSHGVCFCFFLVVIFCGMLFLLLNELLKLREMEYKGLNCVF